ncbi:MAG: tetratricopeptide repeat protein [bacterium]|nr:tetratricopeptide repeat protein [bacterium]
MKRFALLLTMVAAFFAAAVVTTPSAQAGLFGHKAATPTPSPSPSALPTASPEPPDVAIPRLQAKLKANPNDQQAMIELAGQFLGINRPDYAVGLTQRLLQMGDKTARVYTFDGYAMSQLGRLDQATSDLEQAANLDPGNEAVLGQLVSLYVRAGRFTDAERIANRSMVLNKSDSQSLMMLGGVLAAEQKFDAARADYEKALALDTKNSDPIFQIARTYAAQNNIPMAISTIERALALDPQNVQALIFKADEYAAQHDDAKASSAFDDAIVAASSDEQKASIYVRKANYFASEKKFSQAEGIFDEAIARYPKESSLHLAFGDYWAAQKNLVNAQKEWLATLAIDKEDPGALYRLGQLSMEHGKMSDAVGYLKQATALEPDPRALAMLGQAYSYVHDYKNSKDACSKSFQMDRSPVTLACIAGADFEMKNYKEASEIFDVLDGNAKGFLDQNPQMLYIAAESYERTKQNQKAVQAFKRLLPALRKGTPEYAKIQKQIADLSKVKH